MFDWIPLEFYSKLYYLVLLVFVIGAYSSASSTPLGSEHKFHSFKYSGTILLLFVLLYMGLRPISGVFADMRTYETTFNHYYNGGAITSQKDYLFHYFTFTASKIMTVEAYFFVCACLYVVPLWFVSKKWFGPRSFYAFLLLLCSFSFWAYGTNGIRNGIASSLFLLAISRDRRVWTIVILLIAINVHKSMLMPIGGYVLAHFYTKPKAFLFFWILSIPLSLLAGGAFQVLLASFVEDDRATYLTGGNVNNDNFSSTGFRWDFLIYSATAVFMGYYYIFKRNYKDKIYSTLYCTYLMTNALWILVIKANFSNRFAFLSWFMMALVMLYPILKTKIIGRQNRLLAYIILAYFGFTFFMNFILVL